MRITLKIARAEIRALFYSPIAWLLTVVFFILAALAFVTPLVEMATSQQFFQENIPTFNGFGMPISVLLFNAICQKVGSSLYLFIPLLTMGVINKEVNSGSIRLLYSSPIKTKQIVIGKYLGLLAFNLVLLAGLIILAATAFISVINAQFPVYLSSILGLFLLSSAYVAIGIFISSITNYTIVAGLLTFAVFFILNSVSGLWQQYDFVRDITYFLSISGRTKNMINGLITTRDVCYFLLIIGMFLSFTIIKLKSNRESKQLSTIITRYISVFFITLFIGYFVSRPGNIGYWDVGREKGNTISKEMQGMLKELNGEKLKVTLYVNLFSEKFKEASPQARNNYIWGKWEKYFRFHPNVEFDYVYYADTSIYNSTFSQQFPGRSLEEITKDFARLAKLPSTFFKRPEEIRAMEELQSEDLQTIMKLEHNGKKTFLRTYPDAEHWPNEEHYYAAVARLVRDTLPLIQFTSGHFERNPYYDGERNYSKHTSLKSSRIALTNLGMDVDTISLDQKEIPQNTSMLIVADPKTEFNNTEQLALQKYIDQGRNIVFLTKPGKQAIVNPFLKEFGITVQPGTLVKVDPNNTPDHLRLPFNRAAADMANERMMQMVRHEEDSTLLGCLFKGATTIGITAKEGIKVTPIIALKDSDTSWITNGKLIVDSAKIEFNKVAGDIKSESYTIGITAVRQINNKEQRVMVVGEADFMSNFRSAGEEFGNGMYTWVTKTEFPGKAIATFPIDTLLAVRRNTAKAIWISYIYILPGIFLALGTILLIRRSRK